MRSKINIGILIFLTLINILIEVFYIVVFSNYMLNNNFYLYIMFIIGVYITTYKGKHRLLISKTYMLLFSFFGCILLNQNLIAWFVVQLFCLGVPLDLIQLVKMKYTKN